MYEATISSMRADGRHQALLVHVSLCADGTPDVPIRRMDDPGAVFHRWETHFLGRLGIYGFEMVPLVSSVLGCHVFLLRFFDFVECLGSFAFAFADCFFWAEQEI